MRSLSDMIRDFIKNRMSNTRAVKSKPPAQANLKTIIAQCVFILAVTAYSVAVYLNDRPSLSEQAAVDEGEEMLLLAQSMKAQTLPGEPFYHAPLYPYILSLSVATGDLTTDTIAARKLNLFLHSLNAVLLGFAAWFLFKTYMHGLIAAALWMFYPGAITQALVPLNSTLAVTFMLLALVFLLRAYRMDKLASREQLMRVFTGAIFMGLSALVEPRLLALLPGYPLAVLMLFCQQTQLRERILLVLGCLLAAGMPLFGMGMVSLNHSGQFQIIPLEISVHSRTESRDKAHGEYSIEETLSTSDAIRVHDKDYNRIDATDRMREWTLHYNTAGWLALLTLGGVWLIANHKRPTSRLIIGALLIYGLGLILLDSGERYRLPMYALLSLPAAAMLVNVVRLCLQKTAH